MRKIAIFFFMVLTYLISTQSYGSGNIAMGSLNAGTINASNNDDKFITLDSCLAFDIGFCVGMEAQSYETQNAYNINIGLNHFTRGSSSVRGSYNWIMYKLKAGYGNEGFLLIPSIEFTPFPSNYWSRFTVYFGYQSYHDNHGSLSGARFGLGYLL